MVQNLHVEPAWITGTIAQWLEPLPYLVYVLNDNYWRRHADHLKKRQQPPLPATRSDQEHQKEEEDTEHDLLPFATSSDATILIFFTDTPIIND